METAAGRTRPASDRLPTRVLRLGNPRYDSDECGVALSAATLRWAKAYTWGLVSCVRGFTEEN